MDRRQPTLWSHAPVLDLPAARAARDRGIARVAAAAAEGFADQAFAALDRVARVQQRLIVDDIWAALGSAGGIAPTRDKRAMGAVLQRGVREGVILPTPQFQASAQKQCHANPRRIWQSRVYQWGQEVSR